MGKIEADSAIIRAILLSKEIVQSQPQPDLQSIPNEYIYNMYKDFLTHIGLLLNSRYLTKCLNVIDTEYEYVDMFDYILRNKRVIL